MNELNCNTAECEEVVTCDTNVVKVTCSTCCSVIGMEY